MIRQKLLMRGLMTYTVDPLQPKTLANPSDNHQLWQVFGKPKYTQDCPKYEHRSSLHYHGASTPNMLASTG